MVVCLPSLVVASVEAQSGGGVVTSGRVVVRGRHHHMVRVLASPAGADYEQVFL